MLDHRLWTAASRWWPSDSSRGRVHPRRRRRASVHADRRLRHEHRHGRRLQPCLEACRRWCRAGAGRTCCNPTRPSAGRSPSATPSPRANSTSTLPDFTMPAEHRRAITGRRSRRAARSARIFSAHGRGVRLDRRAARRALRRLADHRRRRRAAAGRLRRYMPSGVPGGRAPHYWLDAGRGYGNSLFDHFGTGFTLLRLGGKAAGRRAARGRGAQARRAAQGDRPAAGRRPRSLRRAILH